MADSTIESIGIALVSALGMGAAVGIVFGCGGAVKGPASKYFDLSSNFQLNRKPTDRFWKPVPVIQKP